MSNYKKLMKVLEDKNISRYQLAKGTKIAPSDIYNCFNGQQPFYPKWRKSIAKYLGVNETVLFDEAKRNNTVNAKKKDAQKSANQNYQDNYIMTTIEAQVWNRLSQKPITKEQLYSMTGYNDREIRAAVQTLRNNGYPVMSSSKRSGYWIARNEDEIHMLIAELKSRANEMMNTVRSLENVRI